MVHNECGLFHRALQSRNIISLGFCASFSRRTCHVLSLLAYLCICAMRDDSRLMCDSKLSATAAASFATVDPRRNIDDTVHLIADTYDLILTSWLLKIMICSLLKNYHTYTLNTNGIALRDYFYRCTQNRCQMRCDDATTLQRRWIAEWTTKTFRQQWYEHRDNYSCVKTHCVIFIILPCISPMNVHSPIVSLAFSRCFYVSYPRYRDKACDSCDSCAHKFKKR